MRQTPGICSFPALILLFLIQCFSPLCITLFDPCLHPDSLFCLKMLSKIVEQRIIVKFHVKLGKTPSEIHDLLREVYGSESLSRARVFKWFKRFQDGLEEVEDDIPPGRISIAETNDNIRKVGDLLLSDRPMSIRTIAEIVGIDRKSVRQIIRDHYNSDEGCNKMASQTLSYEEHESRLKFCTRTLKVLEDEPDLMQRIIACDDMWYCIYDHDCQCYQARNNSTPRIKRPGRGALKFVARVIVFYDIHGILHMDWVPSKKNLNDEYYGHVLEQFHDSIREKRPELWKDKSFVLLQNNSRAFSLPAAKELLSKYRVVVIRYPLGSQDLSPSNFRIHPRMQYAGKATAFESPEVSKEKVTSVLTGMTQKDFKDSFQLWINSMKRCRDTVQRYHEYYEDEPEVIPNPTPSGGEGTNINAEGTSGLSADGSHPSETVSQGRSQNTNTNQELVTEDMPNNPRIIKQEPSEIVVEHMDCTKTEVLEIDSDSDSKNETNSNDSIKERMETLSKELADLKTRRQQQETELRNIEALRQKIKEMLNNTVTEQKKKEQEYEQLKQQLG